MDEKDFIGKTLGEDVTEKEICDAFNTNDIRVYHYDEFVTMDYVENRVNVVIDYSNVILYIYMG